ncbi:MAG TPA: CpXC domain-containing protein [Rectinemataceae bacterium]|nr:CpXC domain-containing protein [Rectinemataceae bacterium]
MRIVTCRCEKSFDADLPEEVDLDREPAVIDEILEGNFLSVRCPHCGETIKPEMPVVLSSRRRGLVLRFVPETERSVWQAGRLAPMAGSELLIGFPELRERAMIIRDGLDARCVEILKYFILAKAYEEADPASELLVSYRGKREDGRLSFAIGGLRNDEEALLALPFDRYEKAKKDLPRLETSEPYSAFLLGGYRSIRALEAESS